MPKDDSCGSGSAVAAAARGTRRLPDASRECDRLRRPARREPAGSRRRGCGGCCRAARPRKLGSRPRLVACWPMPSERLGVRCERGSGCFCGVCGDCCWSEVAAGAANLPGLIAAVSGRASTGDSSPSRTVKPYVCFGGSVVIAVSCTTVLMLLRVHTACWGVGRCPSRVVARHAPELHRTL